MKFSLFFILFLAFSNITAFAQTPSTKEEKRAERFQKAKARALEAIDERISKMKEVRDCIAKSSTKDDMQKCREKIREMRKENRIKRETFRKKRQDLHQRREMKKIETH